MKKTGILLPLFSLPNAYGIGTIGKEAYCFIDFLKQSCQDYWQLLPIHPTGYKDSPYQSFSCYAGNPYFIDLDELVKMNLLTIEELKNSNLQSTSSYIDYGKIFNFKLPLLKKTYQKCFLYQTEYEKFKKENHWVYEYALFMALKEFFNQLPWYEWPFAYKSHKRKALQSFYREHTREVEEHIFIQFLFFRQWDALKRYAKKANIELIGDIPIYVAYDSADVWSATSFFQLDEHYHPTMVAGVPPDYFSKTGQLWGNPLYRYDRMKENHYAWWVKRLKHALKLFDVLRIDHFRGFSEYYAIPFGNNTAMDGIWKEGPGNELFVQVQKRLNRPKIIAENLGLLDEKVEQLIQKTQYPGMKILEFEFASETCLESFYQSSTHNFVYPGTHDNDTFIGWYQKATDEEKALVNEQMHYVSFQDNLSKKMIEYCYQLPHDHIIILMQDILGFDSFARINKPGTSEGNWQYRFLDRMWNKSLASYLARMKMKWKKEN